MYHHSWMPNDDISSFHTGEKYVTLFIAGSAQGLGRGILTSIDVCPEVHFLVGLGNRLYL